MNLSPELLVSAYAQGIFPMDMDGEIRWFCPDPRGVLPLDNFHVSGTLQATIRRGVFEIRVNTAFDEVIRACAERPDPEDGTWISEEIIGAYGDLHRLGLAHSVEAWRGGRLAGGLYGVALGGAFFGESMFHHERDASKVALAGLVERLRERNFVLLDIQFLTEHLERFGAIEIPRGDYLELLEQAVRLERRFA